MNRNANKFNNRKLEKHRLICSWHCTVTQWKENNCFSLALLQLDMAVGAAEHTLAWHPRLKWTDTINPRDSGDPLTEQDKVSACAHRSTWPVAHEHNLALMAYIMCSWTTTDCDSIGCFLLDALVGSMFATKEPCLISCTANLVKLCMGCRILQRGSVWERDRCSIFRSVVGWTS